MNKTIPATVIDDGAMYQSERKIYPRDVDGRFARLRKLAVWVLLGIFYLIPWLPWGERQAVLFDLPARKFYIFGLNFWPQDFFFLALLLIMAGLSLFFFTALAGRLWCGYACPQTVWTEVFLDMERWTEGDRNRRMKLDAGPWTREKFLRKGSKHALWLAFALWTGFTFVGFFSPIRDLGLRVLAFDLGGWETFWIGFYSLATWGNAGFLREQVCKYMCPYARFQSAMFDRNTLIIAYDPLRGEPRGSRKRGLASVLERARGLLPLSTATAAVVDAAHHQSAADANAGARVSTGLVVDRHDELPPPPPVRSPDDLGDCIDCTICVQVCPTGIDIRNGLQYECIACGACIDACDAVMDKMDYPRGLIRYTTQNAIDGKPSRILRPRVIFYALLLTAIFSGWAWGVSHRSALIVDVLRDRNALYRVAADGSIENAYTLKLINKTPQAQRYRLEIVDDHGNPIPALRIAAGAQEATAAPEQVLSLAVTLIGDPAEAHGRRNVRFVITGIDHPEVHAQQDTRFFGPTP
ncbi:MAG: 4Fe-4S dicluster domain-containing protein [Xanthomonadaceae bacterium]|nr:4Fe-4S dicluster domain-containing protein [Xanthomonadaceae bacterium]